jgi:tripartite motif-containing protein 71
MDKWDNFWVTTGNSSGVYVYNNSGTHLETASNAGLSAPNNVACDSLGNCWVEDCTNSNVQLYNSSGTYVRTISSSGSGAGQLNCPAGLALVPYVWVVDANNQRIEKFTTSGSFVTQFGCASGACSAGSGNGQFNFVNNGCNAVTVDSSGNIWVVDDNNLGIQE